MLTSNLITYFQQYEDWKKNLPDTEWMKSLIPDVELDKFRSRLIKVGEGIKGKANEIDIGIVHLGKIIDYFITN